MSNFQIMQGKTALQQTTDGFITAIYAESGAGKTRLAVTAARKGKTLYIDSELAAGKLISQLKPDDEFINNFHRPAFFTDTGDERPISMKEVREIIRDKELISQYDVIVIDSLTHVLSQEVKNEKRARGKNVDLKFWGEMGSDIEEFLGYCQLKGIEIVITLHEQEKDDDGVLVKRPKAVGNMAGDLLMNRADTVMYLYKEGEDYVASCDRGAPKFTAKNRLGIENEYRNEEIDYQVIRAQFPKYEVEEVTKEQIDSINALAKETETDMGKLREKVGAPAKGKYSTINAIKMLQYLEAKKKFLANKENDKSTDS